MSSLSKNYLWIYFGYILPSYYVTITRSIFLIFFNIFSSDKSWLKFQSDKAGLLVIITMWRSLEMFFYSDIFVIWHRAKLSLVTADESKERWERVRKLSKVKWPKCWILLEMNIIKYRSISIMEIYDMTSSSRCLLWLEISLHK